MSDRRDPDRAVRWRPGQLAEVRSLGEILATLDADDRLGGMPFMREMVRFCGRRFRVFRLADRVCVEGDRLRRLEDVVLLEHLRCDGFSHDGCQRGCLLFWKSAWLRPVPVAGSESAGDPAVGEADERTLPATRNGRYYCQSTELKAATSRLFQWDPSFLLRDFLRGEASALRLVRVLLCTARRKMPRIFGRGPAGPMAKSPAGELGLKPGDLVEIKSREEIEATLTGEGKNRGLSFELEMLRHCGSRYRVSFPLRKIISEQTGEMIHLSDTVILDGVTCEGTCSGNCPRANHFYWREIWLRRA
jgi:hypothetical protein